MLTRHPTADGRAGLGGCELSGRKNIFQSAGNVHVGQADSRLVHRLCQVHYHRSRSERRMGYAAGFTSIPTIHLQFPKFGP